MPAGKFTGFSSPKAGATASASASWRMADVLHPGSDYVANPKF
ncbi:MAG: hypothetical protein Q7S37_01020 [bacterium]|nr:hypothetical protein [bacterium]